MPSRCAISPTPGARDGAITVLIADDHTMVRRGLRAVLEAAPGIAVVGEAEDGEAAVRLARHLRPDVVIMDLSMPVVDGEAATRALAVEHGAPRVIILTMHDAGERCAALLEAGAAGYVVKTAADRELVDAVRAVASGAVTVRGTAVPAAVGAAPSDARATREARYALLTARERDVFRCFAEGFTAPEIGAKLGISPKTVDTYKLRINGKLGITHRSDYVRVAMQLGLLQGA